MLNEKLKFTIKLFSAVIITLGLSISLQALLAWTPPGDTPPNANVAAPINIGGDPQIKAGSFATNQGIYVEQDLSVNQITIRGGSPGLGKVLKSDEAGLATWQSVSVIEADGIIGNEVLNTTNSTLSRSGLGTVVDPYTLGLNLANSNIWTGTQTFNLVRITGGTPVAGEVLTTNATGQATWEPVFVAETDGIIGNEVLNTTNSTLSRSGLGTVASPYTLGLNLGNSNIWTVAQNFNSTLNHTSEDMFYVNSYDSMQLRFNSAGLQTSGVFGINNQANNRVLTILNNGNVGIGTETPGAKLEVNGEIISTSANSFRSAVGNYGIILRNDGVNTYFLLTSLGDKYGAWNSLRPLRISNSTGDVTFDGNTLHVDATNDGVGIGTVSPGYRLDVVGDIRAQNAWLRTTGNTGWFSDTHGGGWHMTDANWIRAYNSKNVWVDATLGANGGLTIGYGGTTPPARGAIIDGNVGIGTTNPTAKLEVNGKIIAQTPLATDSVNTVATKGYVDGQSGGGPKFAGFAPDHNGNFGGVKGIQQHCHNSYNGSHVCMYEEIMKIGMSFPYDRNCIIFDPEFIAGYDSGTVVLKCRQPGSDCDAFGSLGSLINCYGWTSNSTKWGLPFLTTKGNVGGNQSVYTCNSLLPVACCY